MTEIQVYDRAAWRTRFLRSYQIRVPGADVREGTQPWIDACAIADQLVVQSGVAKAIALGSTLEGKSSAELDSFGADHGVARPEATGAIGWAIMGSATASGGCTPLFGDELVHPSTGMTFQFTGSGSYTAGDPFPVAASPLSKGPATNLEAGEVLQWSAPVAGCDPLALVQEQPDGSGLTGGREKATDDEYVIVLREALANPVAAGNDAEYMRHVENSIGHGVQVEKCFTYPCCLGPGTTAICFTLKPSRVGASRIPNAAQLAAVAGYIGERMPRDDGYFVCQLVEQTRDVYLELDWSTSATGWTDLSAWPPYYSTTAAAPNVGNVIVSSATDSTHFTLASKSTGYTGAAQPSVGQTIAFYDKAKGKFRRKRILTIGGAGPWVIVCDTSSGASDTDFTPEVNQPALPWSDSLDLIVAPVASYLASFGPGEQFASFFDDGSRKRRQPRPPKLYPNIFTNRVEVGVFALSAVDSVSLAEGDGGTTTVGTPYTSSRLQQLRWIAAYPKN